MNIPREAVKIMSGFSDEVAMAVTHPLWPSKEPRKRSDSDIFLLEKVCLVVDKLGLQEVTVTSTATVT